MRNFFSKLVVLLFCASFLFACTGPKVSQYVNENFPYQASSSGNAIGGTLAAGQAQGTLTGPLPSYEPSGGPFSTSNASLFTSGGQVQMSTTVPSGTLNAGGAGSTNATVPAMAATAGTGISLTVNAGTVVGQNGMQQLTNMVMQNMTNLLGRMGISITRS